jgi:hypothetical protein
MTRTVEIDGHGYDVGDGDATEMWGVVNGAVPAQDAYVGYTLRTDPDGDDVLWVNWARVATFRMVPKPKPKGPPTAEVI